MTKLAVFASGTGSNFEAIVQAVKIGELDAEVSLLVSDKPEAKVVEKAEAAGIQTLALRPKAFESKADYEKEILRHLKEYEIDWLVLAGYMRLVGPVLLTAYPGRIVNLHPSLLPAFPGLHAIEQAYEAGVKVTGVTVHFVDEGLDTGPIIAQKAIEIKEDESLGTIEARIHEAEHELYPKTLKALIKR